MGDALVALKNIEDDSVDLIFIAPPYNIGKDFNGYKDNIKLIRLISVMRDHA